MLKTSAVAFCLLVISVPVAAQHHHHGGHGHGHTAIHSGSHWGHSNWSHVAPSHQHYGNGHHGTYYTTGHTHFYTPTVVAYSTTANYAAPPVQAPVQMAFGSFAHTDDLAGRLGADLNNFCLDLHYNYQNNPGYRETYREAYGLLQVAKQLHQQQHAGDRASIVSQVSSIDQQFHHIQEDVSKFNRQPLRQIAMGGVVTKGESIEALIHHLAYDVGVEPHAPEQAPAPLGAGTEVAPPPSDGFGAPAPGLLNAPVSTPPPATLP
ncbi:hypothetical protein Pan44_50940 [Caulifigura coniformis]|uniref:Uncharacterized protein n=1 Tax=Caulifigura coniformis TaxID=2527983 RepID=A0A517SLM7_9PLAN|nr:hypothetical protein [Caulifigura coniformis]QDT57029.1 hypothetical protein Pan44_50940 [Caulifigura coniformis]